MKHALAPLAVLVALTASACGSDDETSDAASDPTTSSSSSASAAGEPGSDDAFCTALVGNGALEDGSDVEALKEGLAASGIPDDAPQDASKGLDVYLEILAEIDTDATAEDLAVQDLTDSIDPPAGDWHGHGIHPRRNQQQRRRRDRQRDSQMVGHIAI